MDDAINDDTMNTEDENKTEDWKEKVQDILPGDDESSDTEGAPTVDTNSDENSGMPGNDSGSLDTEDDEPAL